MGYKILGGFFILLGLGGLSETKAIYMNPINQDKLYFLIPMAIFFTVSFFVMGKYLWDKGSER